MIDFMTTLLFFLGLQFLILLSLFASLLLILWIVEITKKIQEELNDDNR